MSTTAIPAGTSSGQPVLILKEGSSQSRGREAQRNNIAAAKLISEIVMSSFGPRGLVKMLVDSLGDVTIPTDGATRLTEIDAQHPAAKMLVVVSKTTDNEVGDGTTSAVVLAGALLEKAEELLDKDVHPTVIVDGYAKASRKAIEALEGVAETVTPEDKDWLRKVAKTSMQTKLVFKEAEELANLVVDADLAIAEKDDKTFRVDIDNVKVEKKPGGSLKDTKLIQGIVLEKEVVHSGMPKVTEKAKIALVNDPLGASPDQDSHCLGVLAPFDEDPLVLLDLPLLDVGRVPQVRRRKVFEVVDHSCAGGLRQLGHVGFLGPPDRQNPCLRHVVLGDVVNPLLADDHVRPHFYDLVDHPLQHLRLLVQELLHHGRVVDVQLGVELGLLDLEGRAHKGNLGLVHGLRHP